MATEWPQWTTELTAKFVTGEDQLGVEGAAQGYQQYLVPGIITTTDHARYYSFYAWVLYRFIEWPGSSRLLKDLRGSFFKRHEVALIVGSYSHHQASEPLGGLVGSGNNNAKAKSFWDAGDPISLDADYFQNNLGGFGQYYGTAMQSMGIVAESDHPGWTYRLTSRGRALAEAYEQSIADTTYLHTLRKTGSMDSLTRQAAVEYGQAGCICPEALARSRDRDLLRDAFFRFDQTGGMDNPHVRRRRTLGVTLDLVHGADGKLERTILRPALYLGEYAPGLLYQPSEPLSHWTERWKTVEIRHLYTFGLQCLWAAFLLHLGEQPGGLFYGDYLDWVQSQLPAGLYPKSVSEYLDELVHSVGLKGDWREECDSFDQACRQETQHDEYSLYLDAIANSRNAGRLLNLGLEILARLFLRFLPRHRENAPIWQALATRERLPISGFFDSLQKNLLAPDWTVARWLDGLYRECILGQHEFIALEKLRYQKYDTFKFYYRDGRFCWPFANPDAYREPIRVAALRLFNALTILTDLGLVTHTAEGCLELSADGEECWQRILREGDNGG